MEEAKILQAIKDSATEDTVSWGKETQETCDQRFCEHHGVCTYRVAELLKQDNSTTRRMLNKMVKKGLIHKSKNNGGMYCRWWPRGYLAELKSA